MFDIGDEVICINETSWEDWEGNPSPEGPVKNQITQITRIKQDFGFVFLGFNEWPEDEYESSSFRKLDKTLVSTLKHIQEEIVKHQPMPKEVEILKGAIEHAKPKV